LIAGEVLFFSLILKDEKGATINDEFEEFCNSKRISIKFDGKKYLENEAEIKLVPKSNEI